MKRFNHAFRIGAAAVIVALPLSSALPSMAEIPIGTNATSLAAGTVKEVRRLNSTTVEVIYQNGQMLTIDFYGNGIFRLFRDDAGGILRAPYAEHPASILTDNPRGAVCSLHLSQDAGAYYIEATSDSENAETWTVVIDRSSGLLSFKDSKATEPVLQEMLPVEITDTKTTLTFKASGDEYFYGGGVQNGRFSHKGHSIAIENTNNWVDGGVASPTPFFWSTKGYGLLWHTFQPGRYDFGETDASKVILSHNEKYLDVFIMLSQTPEGLLGNFYQLTGQPVLLPKFAFYEGHLNAYNRDYWTEAENGFMAYEDGKRYNESQKDNGGIKESLNGEKNNYQFSARAVIDRYEKADMPLGWILPNDGYGAGYGQTSTLDGNIQNLKSFGDYARSKGVEIGLWTQSDLHPKEGIEPLLQRDIVKEVRDAGVRVLKTDVAWVGAGYSFGLNGVTDVGKIMPYYGNDARPFIISLDGWAGTQRYAGIWTGDQTGGDWEYIRFHIPTYIGSGLSGQPNITSDMDGIFGGKNMPVNIRDFQWKTFTPMQLNMDGWGSNPKYPQALGEPATSINRMYLKLKSTLMPYTYTIAAEATVGKPMIRALFLDYPNDYTHGTKTEYEYLYGPSFLVAPIYKSTAADKDGNDVRNGIYLPEGKWIDYWDGTVYEGGRIVNNYDAPIWKLPVFVKAGAIIPMTNANNNPSQIRKDYRAFDVYPDGESSFTLYDDNGVTQEYLNENGSVGGYALTDITCKQDKANVSLLINATTGTKQEAGDEIFYDGFEQEQETQVTIHATAKPKSVTAKVGDKKLKLREANSLEDFNNSSNVYLYQDAPALNLYATAGSEFAKKDIKGGPQLCVKIEKTNITRNTVEVDVTGYAYDTAERLLSHTGALTAPKVTFSDENIGTYDLTPSWDAQANADYYEAEYDGQLYSTIHDTQLTFDGMQPETDYAFKVRAVNKDGVSDWTEVSSRTKADPYRFAVKGIQGQTTCANQSGQGINKLFDYDQKTIWHTAWGDKATPFTLTMDLKSVNQLDKFEYLPREDAGNGTITKGTVSYSTDRQQWTTPVPFTWARNGETKTFAFEGNPTARYIRIAVEEGAGNFGSGRELYVYKVPGTESVLQGDINHDNRIDENDLTSYMNYTGLRRGDADFDYVSSGDINNNGIIDAYDISVVTVQLDGGAAQRSSDKVEGTLTLTPSTQSYKAGDEVRITVSGKDMKCVNGLSFALPYSTDDFEYLGVDLVNMKDMVNLTYDRLHTNGQKELFPCFVNKGNNFLLEDGELFVIKLRAKKAGKFNLKATDGLLVDRSLGTANPFK